jgi:hypothetical protein
MVMATMMMAMAIVDAQRGRLNRLQSAFLLALKHAAS